MSDDILTADRVRARIGGLYEFKVSVGVSITTPPPSIMVFQNERPAGESWPRIVYQASTTPISYTVIAPTTPVPHSTQATTRGNLALALLVGYVASGYLLLRVLPVEWSRSIQLFLGILFR